jgi:hypothetical protein
MKRFWEIVNTIFDWIMNIIFTAILFGGGAWCIKDIFFN